MWVGLALYVRMTVALTVFGNRLSAPLGREERGQSTVEYALLIALLVVGTMAAIQYFTGGVSAIFRNVIGKVQGL